MAITVTDYQPDDTIAIDTYITNGAADTNYGTNVNLYLKAPYAGYPMSRILLGFDWIWKGLAGANTPGANPKMKFLTDLVVKLYCNATSNPPGEASEVYLIKRNWTEGGVTWNKYNGTDAWATAGGLGAADSDLSYVYYGLTPTAGNWWTIIVPAGFLLKMINATYYGILIKFWLDNSDDEVYFSSSSNATTANRPKYTFSYEPYHKIFPISAGLGQVR